MSVDVGPSRCSLGQLVADLAHEHVHGPLAVLHLPAPYTVIDLSAAYYAILVLGERMQHLELSHREPDTTTFYECLIFVGAKFKISVGGQIKT